MDFPKATTQEAYQHQPWQLGLQGDGHLPYPLFNPLFLAYYQLALQQSIAAQASLSQLLLTPGLDERDKLSILNSLSSLALLDWNTPPTYSTEPKTNKNGFLTKVLNLQQNTEEQMPSVNNFPRISTESQAVSMGNLREGRNVQNPLYLQQEVSGNSVVKLEQTDKNRDFFVTCDDAQRPTQPTKKTSVRLRQVGDLPATRAISKEERQLKIALYREKRKRRIFTKKVSYDCRKKVADQRIRIKGRFVTKVQAMQMLSITDSTVTIDRIKQMLKYSQNKNLPLCLEGVQLYQLQL